MPIYNYHWKNKTLTTHYFTSKSCLIGYEIVLNSHLSLLPSGKLPPSQQSDLQGSHERNRQPLLRWKCLVEGMIIRPALGKGDKLLMKTKKVIGGQLEASMRSVLTTW
ncbi:Uncharacterised protein [uncultured archaeon]|nr:Uncharacterised protein [uncultured archaeon]